VKHLEDNSQLELWSEGLLRLLNVSDGNGLWIRTHNDRGLARRRSGIDGTSEWAGWARETERRRRRIATAMRGTKRPRPRMDPVATKGVSELAMTKATAGRPPLDRSGNAGDERDGNLRNKHSGLGPVEKREQQPDSSANHPI
jgi:hypothetical protein